jgi:hypothetical protein
MELKVHIDKTVRIVCGLNRDTSVQDVIIALAHSLKQTGRFYLIEKFISYSDKHEKAKKRPISTKNRRPRVMSPHERPIELLNHYSHILSDNEDIEFHLIRSDLNPSSAEDTQSDLIRQLNELDADADLSCLLSSSSSSNNIYNNENYYEAIRYDEKNESFSSIASPDSSSSSCASYSLNESHYGLLDDINKQQTMLEEQSFKLDRLLKKIERYEIANIQLSQENESFKAKLDNLETANRMNTKKLSELERETNGNVLKKEVELSEFLKAQRDYYERKLAECKMKLDKRKGLLSDLEAQYEELRACFCYLVDDFDTNELDDCVDEAKRKLLVESHMYEEFNEAIKQAELNKARFEYLRVGSANLDRYLSEKKGLIEQLEKEYFKDYDCKGLDERFEQDLGLMMGNCKSLSSSSYDDEEEVEAASSSSETVSIGFKKSSLRRSVGAFNPERAEGARSGLYAKNVNLKSSKRSISGGSGASRRGGNQFNRALSSSVVRNFEFDDIHYF